MNLTPIKREHLKHFEIRKVENGFILDLHWKEGVKTFATLVLVDAYRIIDFYFN